MDVNRKWGLLAICIACWPPISNGVFLKPGRVPTRRLEAAPPTSPGRPPAAARGSAGAASRRPAPSAASPPTSATGGPGRWPRWRAGGARGSDWRPRLPTASATARTAAGSPAAGGRRSGYAAGPGAATRQNTMSLAATARTCGARLWRARSARAVSARP